MHHSRDTRGRWWLYEQPHKATDIIHTQAGTSLRTFDERINIMTRPVACERGRKALARRKQAAIDKQSVLAAPSSNTRKEEERRRGGGLFSQLLVQYGLFGAKKRKPPGVRRDGRPQLLASICPLPSSSLAQRGDGYPSSAKLSLTHSTYRDGHTSLLNFT